MTRSWRSGAADFAHHPVDHSQCWELANRSGTLSPGRDDGAAPADNRGSDVLRARLCQVVTETDGAFFPRNVRNILSLGEPIPTGPKS